MSDPKPPEVAIQPDLFGGLVIRVGLTRLLVPEELLPQFFVEVGFWAVRMQGSETNGWASVPDGSPVTSTDRSADPKAGK